MNNNQSIIDGLRQAADYLEAHPQIPYLGPHQGLRRYVFGKAELVEYARVMGSFKKQYSDDYFELAVPFGEAFEFLVYCDRSQVCRKIVTYDCEDAESVLKEIDAAVEA